MKTLFPVSVAKRGAGVWKWSAVWGRSVQCNTAAWEALALWGARRQASAAQAIGEDLDQFFIRRGWRLR